MTLSASGYVVLENASPLGDYPFDIRVDTGNVDGMLSRFSVENSGVGAGRVDINVRGANLNIGQTTSADGDSKGGALYLVRGTGDSSAPFVCYKQGSNSVPGLRITAACALDLRNTDLTSVPFTIQNSAANAKVFQITNTGALWWGNTGDTTLTRSAANVLSLGADDCLKTGQAVTASRPSASTMGAGAQFYDITLGVPIWSNGTDWKDAAGTTV